MSEASIEDIGQEINNFLLTDSGKAYIAALQGKYESLLHAAQDETYTMERKAMTIERAAGLNWAIDYLTQRSSNYARGYYTKKTSS